MQQIYDIPIRGFNLKLKISESGFSISPASLLLANNIKIKRGETVCDIGTGCGVQAIIAAKLGAKKVYASDINQNDCETAKENAKLNNLNKKISIFHGDLLSPFNGKKFDVIMTNIPQIPGPIIKTPIQFIGYYGGNDGTRFISKIIKDSLNYLNKNGKVYFQWGQISNPKHVEKLLSIHFSYKKVAKISTPFTFYELKVIHRLLDMKKDGKCFFYYKSGVPYFDKVIYECKLNDS